MQIIKKNLRFRGSLIKRSLTNKIILHHAAGKNLTVEKIHFIHLQKGWAGIGYHFYITKDGKIYEGRPINTVGAHCIGYNATSIGICLDGDFRKEFPTEKQIESLKELVNQLVKDYKLNKEKDIYNHSDLYKTLCPVYKLKEEVLK